MKALQILKSIGLGAIKATPVGNIIEEIKANKESEIGGEGYDYARLAGYGLAALLLIAMILGLITIQDIKELVRALAPLLG